VSSIASIMVGNWILCLFEASPFFSWLLPTHCSLEPTNSVENEA